MRRLRYGTAVLLLLVQGLTQAGVAFAQDPSEPFPKLPPSIFKPEPETSSAPLRPFPLLPPTDPVTNEEVCIMPEPERSNLTPFERNVEDFITAYYADQPFERAQFASNLREEIFSKVGTEEYVTLLQYLDSLHGAYPEAIYDIAKSLQLRWETRYTRGLGQLKSEILTDSSGKGLSDGVKVGVAAKSAAGPSINGC